MRKPLKLFMACMMLGWGFTASAQPNAKHHSTCNLHSNFTFKVDSCTVTFKDTSTAGSITTITGWHWKFGDGDSSTSKNPLHTYLLSGTYEVCLTITGTDTAGHQCKDQTCHYVHVTNCTAPCRLHARFHAADSCLKATFSDSSHAGTGTTITSWHWSFGDGDSSKLQNPVHTYTAGGTYNVCLTITGVNAIGMTCTDKTCSYVKIHSCIPPCKLEARFKVKDSCMTVKFHDISQVASTTTVTSVSWDFGDGSTSSLTNPVHTYTAAGTYTVCLAIAGTNSVGTTCSDKHCMAVNVHACIPCQVNAGFKFQDTCLTVMFTDTSSTGPGTYIHRRLWTFGDGDSSHHHNPVHTFTKAGTYTVCLFVWGDKRCMHCKDSFCTTVKVDTCHLAQPNTRMAAGKRASVSVLEIYPNPAQSLVNVNFETANDGPVNVSVYDVHGTLVTTLQNGSMEAGVHSLQWRSKVPGGLYMIMIKTSTDIQKREIIIQ